MSGKQMHSVSLIDTGFEGHVSGVIRALAIGGKIGEALEAAKAERFSSGIVRWFEKANVDYVTAISGVPARVFLQDGKERGAFDAMIAAGDVRQAPLNTALAIKVGDIAPQARLIGQPVALRSLSLNGSALNPLYCGIILILTKELARAGGPDLEAYISKIGRIAMAEGTDRIAFNAMIDSSTPNVTAATFGAAVSAAIQGVSVSASSRIYLLLSPNAAKLGSSLVGDSGMQFPQLSASGGFVGAHPALRTAALDGLTVAAIDADAVVANFGELEADVSDEADIVMADDPSPGHQNLVSLFQSNSSGVRLLRKFGAQLTRPDAISIATINGS